MWFEMNIIDMLQCGRCNLHWFIDVYEWPNNNFHIHFFFPSWKPNISEISWRATCDAFGWGNEIKIKIHLNTQKCLRILQFHLMQVLIHWSCFFLSTQSIIFAFGMAFYLNRSIKMVALKLHVGTFSNDNWLQPKGNTKSVHCIQFFRSSSLFNFETKLCSMCLILWASIWQNSLSEQSDQANRGCYTLWVGYVINN